MNLHDDMPTKAFNGRFRVTMYIFTICLVFVVPGLVDLKKSNARPQVVALGGGRSELSEFSTLLGRHNPYFASQSVLCVYPF